MLPTHDHIQKQMSQVSDYMTLHSVDYKLDSNIQNSHYNMNKYDNSTLALSKLCMDIQWIHYSSCGNIEGYWVQGIKTFLQKHLNQLLNEPCLENVGLHYEV